jgi:hypothetical protein
MIEDRSLADLIGAARRARLELSSDEWLDICYLAEHVGLRPATGATSSRAQDTAPLDDEPTTWPAPDQAAASLEPGVAELSTRLRGPGPYASLLYAGQPTGHGRELAMRAPTVPPLSRVGLGKAFRRLKRTVDAIDDTELDVPATVRQAADADLWDPVLVPAPDRWLQVAVVVDDAGSGPAWSDEIRAFLHALQDSGAFGGIRLWHFDSDAPPDLPLTVRGGTASAVAGRDPRELIDPSGRRAVLVLADCVGKGWGDGRVARMLNAWAATNAVAIVHLLPQRLWSRCRPRLVPVDWLARRPSTVGSGPRWRPRRDTTAQLDSVVPVFDLTEAAMARWAALVAGSTVDWMPGTALCTAENRQDEPVATDGEPDLDDLAELAPAERGQIQVERFGAVASPAAFRLATLLSTAPLQPPVVRMIQRAALGTDRPVYWAEILLSGLVYRVIGGPSSDLYDFSEGVREYLLTRLARREALDMLHQVSEFVGTRLGGTLDFLALLGVDDPAVITPADRPFARVAVQVLRALGGSYREKAQQLTALLEGQHEEGGPNATIGKYSYYPGADGAMSRDGDLVTSPIATEYRRYGQRDPGRAISDIPPRISHFTGRRLLLDRLRREFADNPNQAAVLVPRALFGSGGVGKTALANEYAHRYGGDYDVVWWIPSEDATDVRRSLVELSRQLQLPEHTDQAEIIRRLFDALAEGKPKSRWLLIYDNARRPPDLAGLLPHTTTRGHVLITSRDSSWREHGTLLQVDAFTRDESVTLLRRRAPHLTAKDAGQLAELLDDLPLALNQAAAWHDETKLSTAEYIRQYEEKLTTLPREMLPDYPQAVGATFGVSYEHLRGRSKAAAQLLQLCSHFGPEAISVDMLWRGRYVPDLPPPLRARMLDRTWLKRELKAVSRYDLIQYDQARDRFQLHRLIQLILRTTGAVGEGETVPAHAQAILAQANPGNPDEVDLSDRAKHAELSPHILPSKIIESRDSEARKVVLDQIRFRYLVGDYEGSRDLARLAVAEWKERFPENDVQLLLAQRHLAMTLRASGEPAEALRLNEYVLGQFREHSGPEDEHSLATANGYASVLRTMGQFREALKTDQDNLERYRATLRNDDPDTLRAANNYAVDLRLIGDFQGAREMDEQTVALWSNTLGPEHPETLFAISNLARDLYGLGRYGEALTMQQDSLASQEATLGPAHPSVLMARRATATLLRKLGRHRQARELAEETYAAYVARFPEHHEQSLAAMVSLANALRDENRDVESLRRARQLCEGALALYQRSFPGHPFFYVCQGNLALILRASGEVAEARRLNTEAEAGLLSGLGERHPYRLSVLTNLASDFAAAGDFAEACRISEATVRISRDESVRGPNHPYSLGCAHNHAIDLEATGRIDEAAELWRDTYARFVAVLGPDHPDSLQARARRRIDADVEPPPT